tara:strand:+ start:153 stop:623 length:471 start_codon:yes stop_codon:yes gene_type:complete
VDSDLIPQSGRLLECSGCNHKWFFKKEIVKKSSQYNIATDKEANLTEIDINPRTTVHQKRNSPSINLFNKDLDKNFLENKIDKKDLISKKSISIKNTKKLYFLNLTIVFIISFVALIIILDTFKNPLGKIVPNIEFLLYNLYESIKDIKLFFKDLL